jgi:hypothetical protein
VATFGPKTAVSHYTFTYDAELQGKHRARTVICSDTWVNDSGAWKTASTMENSLDPLLARQR